MSNWYESKTGRTGCGPGWDAIIFPLIDRANAEGVEIAQIKEKFGGLRFYTYGNESVELQTAIEEAEKAAIQTCEQCGQPGKPRGGGWIKTLCDAHHDEREQRRAAP